MIDHHPLRLAGRAGGVEDIGERRRIGEPGSLERLRAAALVRSGPGADHPHAAAAEALGRRRSGDNHPHPRVLDQGLDAGSRVRRIDRHERRAGLEDAQHRDHGVGPGLERHGHRRLRSGAERPQATGEALRRPRQGGEGQVLSAGAHRHRVRGSLRPPGEALHHRPLPTAAGRRPGRVVPLHQHLIPLGGGEERQLPHPPFRRRHRGGDEPLQVPREALDGGAVEQLRREGQGAAQALVPLRHREPEVELRGQLGRLERPGLEPLRQDERRAALLRVVLEDQHDLEERCMGQAALRLELLDQLLERHVLVQVRRQGRFPGAGQQLPERGLARQVGTEHEGVDEEPDQPLDLQVVAAGDRRAHRQVLLAADPSHQGLEAGQEHHEERRPLLPGERAEPVGHHPRQGERPRVPAGPPLRLRPRPVGGQLERRRQIGELLAPVGDLGLQHGAPQPAPLPEGEVGILDRQLRQGRRRALPETPVERPHLAQQDAHRPAVARDVVEGEQHHVVVRAGLAAGPEPEQRGPEHRPALEIERPRGLGSRQAPRRRLAHPLRQARQVDHRQREVRRIRRRPDHLAGIVPVGGEHRPQHLVATHHLSQARRQGGHLQRALEAHRDRQVVERAARLQPVDEPEPLLGERQRQGPVPADRRSIRRLEGRRHQLGADPDRRLHPTRQARHGRLLEQGPHRQIDAEGRAQARDHPGRQQGVTAEGKEVLAGPHPIEPQDLLPDPRHHLFHRCPRRDEGGRLRLQVRHRQSLAVHLAVGGQREGLEDHPHARHHVLRQMVAEHPPKGLRLGLPLGRSLHGHHVGHQPLVSGRVLARQDHRLPHRVQPAEGRLDLAQLDPEAPHLDLVVRAAQEVQRALRQPAHQVAGAVEPCPRLAGVRVRHEALRRQPRPTQVPPRQTGPAEQQLAGHPHRHRPVPPVHRVGPRRLDRPADRHTDRRSPAASPRATNEKVE